MGPFDDLQFLQLTADANPLDVKPDDMREKNVEFDIPLRKGVIVTGLVRDSRTKQPLADVDLVMKSEKSLTGRSPFATDEKGYFKTCLCPGATYRTLCRLPKGYLLPKEGVLPDVVAPSGVDHYELPPFDLTRACSIEGEVQNAGGQPLLAIRIRATWTVVETKPGLSRDSQNQDHVLDVERWVTTNRTGNFRVGPVAAGTKVKLVAVRSGALLAEPIQVVAGDEKPLQLRQKKCDLVALSGRILGSDRKPIADAQVVVEVANSVDKARFFRTWAQSDGSFKTPAIFPSQHKYRVTVRSILDDVVSTQWICPAASGNKFPDVVVDRAKLSTTSELSGHEIVARVNDQPILAAEILERAFTEVKQDSGVSLYQVSKLLEAARKGPDKKFSAEIERNYRRMQDAAIRRYVGDYVRSRLHTKVLLSTVDQNKKALYEKCIEEMWRAYVEKLKERMNAATDQEFDGNLRAQGTSASSVRSEFRYNLFADEYLRIAGGDCSDDDRKQLVAYYREHRKSYSVPEKVVWELLEIEFARRPKRRPTIVANGQRMWPITRPVRGSCQ